MPAKVEHRIIDETEYKHCPKCGQWLTLNKYRKNSSKWDRLDVYCKECRAEMSRIRYKKDEEYRTKKIDYSIAYYKEHPRKIKYKHKYNPQYYKEGVGKEKKLQNDKLRKWRMANNGGDKYISKEMREKVFQKYDGRCAYCGKECIAPYHIDHKIPVCRGGSTTLENLALACKECNQKKYTLTDIEFVGHAV